MPCDERWNEFRDAMEVARKYAYFDHAAVAPISTPARDAMRRWTDDLASAGDLRWPEWAARVEAVRRAAAAFIGADPEEIAFVPNTTAGLSLVAEGFPWQAGDNVVTPDDEFPSNAYPWMNLAARGVETRRVACGSPRGIDIDALAAACDRRTRIVAISWVGYLSGWRNNVDQLVEMAHARGALLCLDAIQGLGVFPLDLRDSRVDFLAADGHKWMLGPEGAGLLYVRRDHLERLRPTGVGWNSVAHSHDFTRIELRFKESAARFEGGTLNMGGIVALGASLELLARHAGQGLADRVLDLAALTKEALAERGARLLSNPPREHSSGIVTFEMPTRDPSQVRQRCLAAGVVLSRRGQYLRASPHAYNNSDDVERLADSLR